MGKNPTDRGKLGAQRSMLTDGGGVPIGVVVEGANRQDGKMVRETIASIPVARPAPTADHPQGRCLDQGYDDDEVRDLLAEFGFTAHIRVRGEEAKALTQEAGYKARRWVVEISQLSYPYPDKCLLSYDWPDRVVESRHPDGQVPASGRGRERELMSTHILPPPPIGRSELIQLWMRLPAAHRQRLLWRLSQLLAHPLSAAATPGEDSDESALGH